MEFSGSTKSPPAPPASHGPRPGSSGIPGVVSVSGGAREGQEGTVTDSCAPRSLTPQRGAVNGPLPSASPLSCRVIALGCQGSIDGCWRLSDRSLTHPLGSRFSVNGKG